MTLTSAEARKRWAEVLDSADRGEATVITRRGKPRAVVIRWREPNIADPLPLCALMPEGWRWLEDPSRGMLVFLHRSGLWLEADRLWVVAMTPEQARAVVAAVELARGCGVIGEIRLMAELRDGAPAFRVHVCGSKDDGWSTSAASMYKPGGG